MTRPKFRFAFVAIASMAITAFIAMTSALKAQAKQIIVPAASDAFYGMRLGETRAQLRSTLGAPVIKAHSETGDFWSYRMDHNRAWRVAIIQRNRIVGIYVRQELDRTSHIADGTGLALSDSQSKMFELLGASDPFAYSTYAYATSSGVYRLYEITNYTVTGMGITRSYGYALAPGVTWDRRDGETLDRAFLVLRPQRDISTYEAHMVATLPCNINESWHIVTTTHLKQGGRRYDRIVTGCGVQVYRHVLYFDVSDAINSPQPR